MRNLWKYFILTLIILILVSAALYAYSVIFEYIKDKYSPNENIEQYFSDDQTDLIVNFSRSEFDKPVRIINGEILVRYEVIKEYIDPNIYYDEDRGKIIITTSDKVFRLTENSLIAQINKNEMNLDTASQRFDGYLYVPISAFMELWNINAKYISQYDTVIIESYKSYDYTAVVNIPDAVIRKGPSIKEPIYIKDFPQDQMLYVKEVQGEWTIVMTANGVVGFIETKFLNTDFQSKQIVIKYEPKKLFIPDHVVLTWHYVHSSLVTSVPYYADVNVISPTFFTVIDEKGSIASSASLKYMENAHKRGYTVWPLINNVFSACTIFLTISKRFTAVIVPTRLVLVSGIIPS